MRCYSSLRSSDPGPQNALPGNPETLRELRERERRPHLTPPANRPELSLGQLLVAAVAMIALVLSADVAVAQPQRDFSEDQEFSALAG